VGLDRWLVGQGHEGETGTIENARTPTLARVGPARNETASRILTGSVRSKALEAQRRVENEHPPAGSGEGFGQADDPRVVLCPPGSLRG